MLCSLRTIFLPTFRAVVPYHLVLKLEQHKKLTTMTSDDAQQQAQADGPSNISKHQHSSETGSETECGVLENVIDNLDKILSRFGDASFAPQHQKDDCNNDSNSLVRTFAPLGLEEPFQQLYSILYPCLCSKESSTGSAIIMGPRGSGKSLLVERVLEACQRGFCRPQHDDTTTASSTSTTTPNNFRKVSINGIVIRGEDVPSVIFEIIRQLSDIALQESTPQLPPPSLSPPQDSTGGTTTTDRNLTETTPHKDDVNTTATTNTSSSPNDRAVFTKRRKMENYLLRLRQSSFTSNLSLLEATLKISEVDEIPILLILDELDSFTDEGERQLLLYHLLDRVATPGSNLCLVGLTSSFTAMSILEKRIRSRAEGSSKVIYVQPPSSYERLIDVLGHQLQGCYIRNQVLDWLTSSSGGGNRGNTSTTISDDNHQGANTGSNEAHHQLIVQCMERQFRLGKDLRWFSRVLSCALSMYRYDLVAVRYRQQGRGGEGGRKKSTLNPPLPRFQSHHLLQSLLAMGATLEEDRLWNNELPNTSSTSMSSSKEQHNDIKVASDPRMQALLDLSTPQVIVLLCARRLLARDGHRDELAIHLTVQRIFQEYESYRGGGGGGSSKNHNNKTLLWPAIWQLLDRGVLVSASDHSGGGSLQYHAPISYKTMDPDTLSRLPLHLPMEVDHELGKALKENWLDCSTALKEWGRKTN